jgi:hypothetical protein
MIRAATDLYACAPSLANNDQPGRDFVIEQLDEESIVVRFRGEKSLVRGRAASRLLRLIQRQRVHVLELGGNLKLRDALPEEFPVFRPDQVEVDQGQPLGAQRGSSSLRRQADLSLIHKKINERRSDLDKATSELEREELQRELKELLREARRSLGAADLPSEVKKARGRVQQDFKRMRRYLSERMPRFAEHLESAIDYDQLDDHFVYKPAGTEWSFG